MLLFFSLLAIFGFATLGSAQTFSGVTFYSYTSNLPLRSSSACSFDRTINPPAQPVSV